MSQEKEKHPLMSIEGMEEDDLMIFCKKNYSIIKTICSDDLKETRRVIMGYNFFLCADEYEESVGKYLEKTDAQTDED